MRHLLLIFLSAILLSACASQSPMLSPSSESLQIAFTATPMVTPTSTITKSPSLTPPLFPTPSKTLAIPTATQADPFPKPSPNPTAYFLAEKWHTLPFGLLFSPNGEWTASSVRGPVEVTNITTDLKRLVPCSLFSRSCASLREIHWSKDSRYIYVASMMDFGETSWNQPLFSELGRLDAQSGKFEKLVENLDIIQFPDGTSSAYNYDFSISPDDRYLAYVKSISSGLGDKIEFGVLTLDKLEEIDKRTLDGIWAANIFWSPSSSHLIFHNDGIVYYDLDTKTLRNVLQDPDNVLLIRDWDAKSNLVHLQKIDDDHMSTYWYFNPFNGQTLPATTPIPAPNATKVALATTREICIPVPAVQWYTDQTSPDGKWIATPCDNEDSAYLRIIKLDGSRQWRVSFRELTGSDFLTYGDNRHSPSLVLAHHWDKDSRFLYIVPYVLFTDEFLPDGLGLYRFDTETGKSLPLLHSAEGYNFAFSPNDQYYVYYSYSLDDESIHITHIRTGVEQVSQLPGNGRIPRRFLWSPDSLKFVFVYDEINSEKSSLLLFDTFTKTYATLRGTDQSELVPLAWISSHELILQEQVQGQSYSLDIDTQQLSPIPTTQ